MCSTAKTRANKARMMVAAREYSNMSIATLSPMPNGL